jgi:hypothetical protein
MIFRYTRIRSRVNQLAEQTLYAARQIFELSGVFCMLRFTAFLLLMLSLLPHTWAGIINDLPDAVVCSVKDPTGRLEWEELVFFVSAHMRDGDTLYKTLTSGPVILIVAPDGLINAPNLIDCDGRSIFDLVDAGRAFDLTRR